MLQKQHCTPTVILIQFIEQLYITCNLIYFFKSEVLVFSYSKF